MDVYVQRLTRLEEVLRTRFSGRKADLARALDMSESYVSRMLNRNSPHHKRMGEDLARSMESKLQLPRHWFDGDSASRVAEPTALHGISISREGVIVGSEWEKLQEPLRSQIQTLIETLVAKQVRSGRKKKEARQETSRSARQNA